MHVDQPLRLGYQPRHHLVQQAPFYQRERRPGPCPPHPLQVDRPTRGTVLVGYLVHPQRRLVDRPERRPIPVPSPQALLYPLPPRLGQQAPREVAPLLLRREVHQSPPTGTGGRAPAARSPLSRSSPAPARPCKTSTPPAQSPVESHGPECYHCARSAAALPRLPCP